MFGRGGFDSGQMRKMMKQMGIEMNELSDVEEVIIKQSDKELIFPNAQVQVIEAEGQKTYQIIGKAEERETEAELEEEDIEMVMEEANVDKETATEALEDTDGDIAQAIVNLKES